MRALLVLLLLAPGCGGDDECGPGDAPVAGVTATLDNGTVVTYGSFTSSPNTDPVRLVDVNASVDPCTYRLDFTADPSATITFSGYCSDGTDEAGYAITLAGSVMLRETCGTDLDTISVNLAGSVAVTAQ